MIPVCKRCGREDKVDEATHLCQYCSDYEDLKMKYIQVLASVQQLTAGARMTSAPYESRRIENVNDFEHGWEQGKKFAFELVLAMFNN